MSRSDLTQGSDSELLYVYLKNGAVELVRDNYTVGRDLMIQIYNPLDHVEPLKSMYWRVFNGQGLLREFSRYFWYDPDPSRLCCATSWARRRFRTPTPDPSSFPGQVPQRGAAP